MFEKIQEIPSIRRQEKQILNLLEKDLITIGGFKKNHIKVVRIESNLFSVGNEKNIAFYCNEKWEIFFNVQYLREQPFFKNFLFTAGYREEKNENGEYKLSRTNLDSSISQKKEQEEIPLYSKEYFSIWEDVEFYKDRFTINIFHRKDRDGNYHSLSEEKIQELIKAKSVRPKDFILFMKYKQITKETYNNHMQELMAQIPYQIGNLRLIKINDIVTIEEIQEYLKSKLITKETFALWSKQIKSRDELLGNTENKKEWIKEETSLKLKH